MTKPRRAGLKLICTGKTIVVVILSKSSSTTRPKKSLLRYPKPLAQNYEIPNTYALEPLKHPQDLQHQTETPEDITTKEPLWRFQTPTTRSAEHRPGIDPSSLASAIPNRGQGLRFRVLGFRALGLGL